MTAQDLIQLAQSINLMQLVQSINPWWVAAGIVGYLLYAVLLWLFTWVFYVATMGSIWAGHQIKGPTVKLVSAMLSVAWGLNVTLNYTVMTVLFLELPRWGEPNVSARFLRLRRWSGENWRQRLADKLCTVWIDAFDPAGVHV